MAEDPSLQPRSTRRGAAIRKLSRKNHVTRSRSDGKQLVGSWRDTITLRQTQMSTKLALHGLRRAPLNLQPCPNLLCSAGKLHGFQGGPRRQQRPKSKPPPAHGETSSTWEGQQPRAQARPMPLCLPPPHQTDHIRCIKLNPCSRKSMPVRAVILD